MNVAARQAPTAANFESAMRTAERRRVLSLSVAAVLMVDAGLILMALDQEDAAAKLAGLFVHAGNPPDSASGSNIQGGRH